MRHTVKSFAKKVTGYTSLQAKSRELSATLKEQSKEAQTLRTSLEKTQAELAEVSKKLEKTQNSLTASRAEREKLEEELKAGKQSLRTLRARAKSERERRLKDTSFNAFMGYHRTVRSQGRFVESPRLLPKRLVGRKLRNYAFAQSHGVNTPHVYGAWKSPQEIDLSLVDAPRVVLKSDVGHSARGVIVLIATDSGWRTLDGEDNFTGNQLPAHLAAKLANQAGPYFAEEYLGSPETLSLPEDIKIYIAYGHVLQVLIMQVDGEGVTDRKSFSRKYYDEHGNDLGEIIPGAKYSETITPPPALAEMIDHAKLLSTAYGEGFIRVDFYDTSRGPVLGELTLTPGGRQEYVDDHDERMGQLWGLAQATLELDLASGRPFGNIFGDQPYQWWYEGLDPEDTQSYPTADTRIHAHDSVDASRTLRLRN